ncbi:MAG: TonB-dependent receptor [Flavobacteriaceae bacterium]|nr:TonB-dependent receptor [Flavobacteriaceae bacterium]
MLRVFIVCSLLLLPHIFYAQEATIQGKVTDSIGKPLALANLIASKQADGTVANYAITDSEGRYKLMLEAGNSYSIKTSYLGYATKVVSLHVEASVANKTLNIQLQAAPNMLEGVEVVYEMPVQVKGDTIIYKTDKFTNGKERKLKDVIKKLPGMEVTKDGDIKVEGKKVKKVLVEGEEFFGGDSKMANENIPADAVDKVEVLRNFNEVDQMKGLNNNADDMAINIKLKEGNKSFWFGTIAAAVGMGDADTFRFLANPKLFYYSKKYSVNIITNSNNIGEAPFSFMDYFRFTGGFKNFGKKNGTSFNTNNSSGLSALMAANNRLAKSEANFAGANFTINPNKKWKLGGFGLYANNNNKSITQSLNNYVLTDTREERSATSQQESSLALLKLNTTYKPNRKLQIDWDGLAQYSDQLYRSTQASVLQIGASAPQNNLVESKQGEAPWSVQNDINAYYTLHDNHVFSGRLVQQYEKNKPLYAANQDQLPFPGVFTGISGDAIVYAPLQQADRYRLEQQSDLRTNQLDAEVNYYSILSKRSHLQFNLGHTYSKQDFNSGIFQLLDNGSNRFSDDIFNNEVSYWFGDSFIGVHWKQQLGPITLQPGVSTHYYALKDVQAASTNKQADWRVLPRLDIKWRLSNSQSISGSYSNTAAYTQVENLAMAYRMKSFTSLFRGNRNLEAAVNENYSLRYFNFNMFSYVNLNISLKYSKKKNALKSNQLLDGIQSVQSLENMPSNLPDESWSGNLYFSKKFSKIELKTRADIGLSHYYNTINTILQKTESLHQHYEFSLRSNFMKAPNFELGYSHGFSKNAIVDNSTQFETLEPYAELDINLGEHWSFYSKFRYNYYFNEEKTVENKNPFLEVSLFYSKKDSPWEFRVDGKNLLQSAYINQNNFTQTIQQTTQYEVLPAMVLVKAIYKL